MQLPFFFTASCPWRSLISRDFHGNLTRNKPDYNMRSDVGVETRNHVIEHYPRTAFEISVYKAPGEGFKDIKKPEKNKD
jgi:hypothetical protein